MWRPTWPCVPFDVLRTVRRGATDPTFRHDPDGTVWRAMQTPAGAATLRIRRRADLAEIHFDAWGPGAEWALETAPSQLGADDDISTFAPQDRRVRDAWLRDPHWRVPRTGLVMEALVGAIIEQKVTGLEAWLGWRLLVRRFGPLAPGPGGERGMRCLPDAATMRLVPSWEWLRCHIDNQRSDTIMRAARVAGSLERLVGLPCDEVDRRLRSIPGVGRWTSAEVRQRAFGDADAVSFGDYHVAAHVGYALTGERADDERLAVLLETERPHRYRIQHVATTRMAGPPRHGPRMAPRTHLPR